ncbi:MAG: stage III sporulation protein AE [Alistipes sp.]|nr:stage III sporulation protein AE [Alistipes sp.]
MKTVKKIGMALLFLFLGTIVPAGNVYGASLDEYDLEGLDGYIDENDFAVDYTDIVESLYRADDDYEKGIVGVLFAKFIAEARGILKTLSLILGVILCGAVFKNVTDILKEGTVMKTGAFVTYITVMLLLFITFQGGFSIAKDTCGTVMEFLYALVPTFFCAVTFTGGNLTGMVMYQWTGLCVSLIHTVVVRLLLPLTNYYVVLALINNGMDERKFNSLCRLLKKGILFVNRGMIGILVGMTAIKSLTVPLADNVKNTFLRKAIAMIPGVGNGVEGIAETVAGTGNLIKNTIGAAGLVTVVLLIAVPFIRLLVMNVMVRLVAAVTEPVADKNVTAGMNAVCDGIGILQYLISTSSMVLMIIIGMICMATGV